MAQQTGTTARHDFGDVVPAPVRNEVRSHRGSPSHPSQRAEKGASISESQLFDSIGLVLAGIECLTTGCAGYISPTNPMV